MSLERIDAEEFSQSLEQIGEGWFRQLALGIKLGAPEALGLTRRQWSDRIGVTVRGAVERRGAVTELAAEGLSNRAIADVLGIDDRTVRRDLAGPQSAANAAPDCRGRALSRR
jgi:DNA-binding NarL/FixJ family response regulator